MDADRFDHMTRMLGEQRDRRGMVKAATGSALAMLGMGALGRAAIGQEVEAESNGYKGNRCFENNDCKTGLDCKGSRSGNPLLPPPFGDPKPGRCQYKSSCGGKKGQACKNDNDCCKNKNLVCQNKKCKRD